MFMHVHTCMLVHGDVILKSGVFLHLLAGYHRGRASQLNSELIDVDNVVGLPGRFSTL